MNGIFDDEKYKEAADKCVAFIKRQLNVNDFKYVLSFAEEYSSYFTGDVLWGNASGLSDGEEKVEPKYVSVDKYYDYSYKGQVEGSCSGTGGVNIYVYRDKGYLVATCPVENGRWISEATYRETYLIPDYDPETGEQIGTHEEVVSYTIPIEVQEGIKMFRYCKTVTSYWEDVSQPGAQYEKAERLVYVGSDEVADEEGGNAYPYFTEFKVRLYSYSDTEYMDDDCEIYKAPDGSLFWFTILAAEGTKIAKMLQKVTKAGEEAFDVVAISGAISNVTYGRLPASFLVPADDPQYDKDGSKAKWVNRFFISCTSRCI